MIPITSEEFLFLTCTEKERQELMHMENVKKSPSVSINIKIPDHSFENNFCLTFTRYGFQFSDKTTGDICAHNYLNKDLSKETSIDIDLLRGLLALVFINLENYIRLHFDMSTMIYSPSITDYLYKCIRYLS